MYSLFTLRILSASAEFSPLARTGGLGDAVAGLLAALAGHGHSVSAVLPRYQHFKGEGEASPGDGLWTLTRNGVRVMLLDDPVAFDRPGIYAPTNADGYEDAWVQWGRFAVAVAEMAEDFDVLHLHDAHAGGTALISPIPTVFTVHNPAHPVLGPLADAVALLGVGDRFTYPTAPLEWYGEANYLKAGIVGADQATTVSPGFASQLGSHDSGESFGLGGVIRSLSTPLVGILNGIDSRAWDPASDPLLPANFSVEDPSGRQACRAALLERSGLDGGTLFGMVGRVSGQKGIDLIDAVIDELVGEGLRLIVVGGGDMDPTVDSWVEHHQTAIAHFEFADDIARLVFAGADAYLMPSAFEPSGLGQLYAMRYGCPPVVRLTGGLADSVVDIVSDPDRGTGVGFEPYEAESLKEAVRRAMALHQDSPDVWEAMRRRGMEADWSWNSQATKYEALYEQLVAE